jgi:hypothetical protein
LKINIILLTRCTHISTLLETSMPYRVSHL